MSVDPLSYHHSQNIFRNIVSSDFQTNIWAHLNNPKISYLNSMASPYPGNDQGSEALIIYSPKDENCTVASCIPATSAGIENNSNGAYMLSQGHPPSEYQLFGVSGGAYSHHRLQLYATGPMTNRSPIVFGETNDSFVSKSNHTVSTQRMQHYHQRHHVYAQKQGNGVKNKARFSATGQSHNYMVVRDSKMSLSSAPSSPNAGSVGGSLGSCFPVNHAPIAIHNNPYGPIQPCKASSSSSSSYSSKNFKMSASSSLSSYSSCSSLSSTPSMNGISPRKRRADDATNNNKDCRKDYHHQGGEVINLCSCETCTTEDVTARVDDVTLRDTLPEEDQQRQKRSKNDDDVVFVSAELAPVRQSVGANNLHSPDEHMWPSHKSDQYHGVKDRSVRKTKKTGKKITSRPNASPTQQRPSQAGSFPFVMPSNTAAISSGQSQALVGRYFLRSAAKGRKQGDLAVTEANNIASCSQSPASVSQEQSVAQSIVAPVVTQSVARAIDLNNNSGLSSYCPTVAQKLATQETTGTVLPAPRYHTRSHQKKIRPEAKAEEQHQTDSKLQFAAPANVSSSLSHQYHHRTQPPLFNHHVIPSSSNYHAGSVIQSGSHYVPTSTNNPPVSESAKESSRSSSSFKKIYDIHGIIGVGGGGTVYAGTRKSDGVQVAIKQVPKAKVKRWGKLDDRVVPIEFELLYRASHTSHKGIIGMVDWYERRTTYILVMERPQPVIDLFDYLNQYGALTEVTARSIFRQIAEAVLHCHANGVVHRDIKDENVLLNLHTSEAKLIDFGCGTVLKDTPFTEFAGTPEFYPPEWFTHRRYYGRRVDAWSLGVLLYTMVEAEVPFQKEKDIVECNLRHKRADRLSDSCKHLIAWMLQKDQNVRPTIAQALNHPWFTEVEACPPVNGVMGTDELYEKRLHLHQNGSDPTTQFTATTHKVASADSPESPPRFNQDNATFQQQRANCQLQSQQAKIYQTECRA